MTPNYSPTRYAGAKEFFALPEGDNQNAIWNRPLDNILDEKLLGTMLEDLADKYGVAPTPLLKHPEDGSYYWTATLNPEKPAIKCEWKSRRVDKIRFSFGNIFSTEDEAVLAHISALLTLKVVQADRAKA